MSKRRLIPKLQLRTSQNNPNKMVLVITKQFNGVIEIGDPVSQAKIFQAQAADELIFIDINRNHGDILKLAQVINKVSEEIFMPITVGGGVKTVDDFRLLLSNGADKISINTAAVQNSDIIKQASDKYGAQCVVVSIDYKKNAGGDYKVFIEGGQIETDYHPLEWALLAEERGAGELLLCNIDHDGMRIGLDLEITRSISESVKIPIITSGGCGLAQQFSDGFLLGKADAVAAGSFFAHRDQNFMQTRSQIKNSGVDIRMHK
ncbi:MAG: imidazole glycerol phosphate synthase cyclase subunit [Pedobacter sp.]|uniref:imidazole glycerol phosphate synthase subunit HisF n=1 Tax=Pedobacter sp. TaxID=1411316 RepID=UPI002808853A|nr:imidazole glycerol phosphate synthase cyclase subunit [Pedobacter sp.]MDQ8004321.1 imidazole glycerol phosphate synthase cyclase subunit [Pedobacter sp.]